MAKSKKIAVRWNTGTTTIQSNVLIHLGRFKFLTLSQLLSLDVGTTQYKYLWEQVASLRDRTRSLVRSDSFNSSTRFGKVEDMYSLNKRGKQTLVIDLHISPEEVKMPIGRFKVDKDYHHRKSTIDFHIHLYKWAKSKGILIDFFDTYFDKTGNNRTSGTLRAKTRIDLNGSNFFIPDAIFKLSKGDWSRHFLFEMERGIDTGKAIKKIHLHALSLVERYTHQAYQIASNKSYTIIFLLERNSLKEALIKRAVSLGDTFSDIHQFILCKSLDEMSDGGFVESFYENWTTILGEKRNLF